MIIPDKFKTLQDLIDLARYADLVILKQSSGALRVRSDRGEEGCYDPDEFKGFLEAYVDRLPRYIQDSFETVMNRFDGIRRI
jgi:hypothetical protein